MLLNVILFLLRQQKQIGLCSDLNFSVPPGAEYPNCNKAMFLLQWAFLISGHWLFVHKQSSHFVILHLYPLANETKLHRINKLKKKTRHFYGSLQKCLLSFSLQKNVLTHFKKEALQKKKKIDPLSKKAQQIPHLYIL